MYCKFINNNGDVNIFVPGGDFPSIENCQILYTAVSNIISGIEIDFITPNYNIENYT